MKKRFGQHFLSDRNILNRIVSFARISPNTPVVEIGPGSGALTRQLAQAGNPVIAIEIDRDWIQPLRDSMPANVEIVEGDALEFDFAKCTVEPFHLVGNLPYNVATPLFKRFIQFRGRIRDVTVMIQKEVAERVVAGPDDAAYGPLSVLVQYYAIARYGFTVPPGAFRPRPKVDSAVIRLDWREDVADAPEFTDFVHKAFAARRKKLANNLLHLFPGQSRHEVIERLGKANVPADARPENLSVADFLRLHGQFSQVNRRKLR